MPDIINFDINEIEYNDEYFDTYYKTLTIYFKAPKKYLCEKFPDADFSEISVELPESNFEAICASVMISPVKIDDGIETCYDWHYFTLMPFEIEQLIDFYLRKKKGEQIMPTFVKRSFRENLIQSVKDAGNQIANNAEDIVGQSDMLSDMTITITFDPSTSMLLPTIKIDKNYLCKERFDRVNKENYNNECKCTKK